MGFLSEPQIDADFWIAQIERTGFNDTSLLCQVGIIIAMRPICEIR